MKIVPYRKGFSCKKNDKDNWGIAGATNEVATLKEAVAAAERNAATECTEREKQEARVAEVQKELQDLVKKHESLELLLYLRHPRLLLLSPGALRGRITFGRRHRLLQGRHLGRGTCNTNVILANFLQPNPFL